ncbi:substrate-binding domain-containing protein [Brevibacillus fulvus]|uniref:Ribose transport system substrate-binding protein n=1 Tax=Brevibacillus fulvus TaxID=1125967 RepID=A0A938XWC5_9BACL|nr:substrate-binding domain-containing protein [Brevibacillus fulvus]MBM7588883.1 ribose transport system substrate-binding protein [Brevibacillus fulvus]
MKRGTRLGSLVSSLLLISLLTGCGGGAQQANQADAKPDSGTAKAEKVIGMSFPFADHGWMGAVIEYAKQQGEEAGVKVEMTTADNPNKQTNDVEDLLTKKVDVLVMLPIETDALTPAVDKVKEANIPLVVFDREVANDNYTALVKGDNEGIGKNAAAFIGEQLGGKGNVVVISGPPSSVTTQRVEGFTSVIQEKYPDIKILADQNGEFRKEKGYEVMQNLLQAQSHIDAVYTIDDEMALGALQAIREAKRSEIKVVTGAGGAKDFYKEIKDASDLTLATFTYSPLMVKEAVKVGVDIANGKTPAEKNITLPAEKVSKDNVDQFYVPDASY